MKSVERYCVCMKKSIPHYDVVFATPGSSMKAEYVRSMVRTTALLNELGYTYTFINQQSSFVSEARELTAIDSYSNDWKTNTIGGGKFTYSVVVWIDSDIEWEPEDVIRLWETGHPIVAGLYQTDPTGRVAVNFPDEQGRPTIVNKVEFLLHDEPVKVGGVGFGFVLMRCGVFERVERPWFLIRRIKWDDVDFYTNVGEDYSWCAAAQMAGFDIWVHPQVKVKHHKETVYII